MDKERFDSLMKLAEFRIGIREARRSIEWRLSLGLWLGMGAGIISLRNVPQIMLMTALIFLVVCYTWFWIRWNWVSGERDARKAYYYAEIAEAIILVDAPKAERRSLTDSEKIYGFLFHGPPIIQILATILLAIGLAMFSGPTRPDAVNSTSSPTAKQGPNGDRNEPEPIKVTEAQADGTPAPPAVNKSSSEATLKQAAR